MWQMLLQALEKIAAGIRQSEIFALGENLRRSQPCKEVGRNILGRAKKGWDHMCKTVIRSAKGTY